VDEKMGVLGGQRVCGHDIMDGWLLAHNFRPNRYSRAAAAVLGSGLILSSERGPSPGRRISRRSAHRGGLGARRTKFARNLCLPSSRLCGARDGQPRIRSYPAREEGL